MLDVRGITKTYRGIAALEDVSFAIEAGEIVGYVGPNGAGKSTTVKILTGMLEPSSGEVLFEGRPILSDLPGFRAVLGYMPEEAHIYTHLSALEYLELVGRLREMSEVLIRQRARMLLDQMGLDSWRYSPVGLYSKGMKQRVLIAAAILHDPKLLVFDEPLSGLDVTTARLFRDLLVELAGAGKAILYISHGLEVVEKVCGRVLVLARGRVQAEGSPEELSRKMQLAGLEAVFAKLTGQQDTRAVARAMVEGIHAG